MKEAFGGISLFQIVVVFILAFAAVMCFTINHSKAFGVKDEILTILNNVNSVDAATATNISEKLKEVGYRTTGNCPDSTWQGYNKDGVKVSGKAAFCIKTNKVSSTFNKELNDKCATGSCTSGFDEFPNMVYYEIVLFYKLDIPIIGDAMDFTMYGSTKIM